MSDYVPAGSIPFPCPDEDCHRICATGRKIAVEVDPFENDCGEAVCSGFCYQFRPPETFEVSYEAALAEQEKEEPEDLAAHVTAEADRVIATFKGTPKTREEVVAFVRSLYDKNNPRLSSLPKVVAYVRSLKDRDDPNFAQCAEVRVLVQGLAKKVKGGVDATWRSIAQEAKLSHGKKKSTGMPGIVPILYRGSDFL